MKSLIRKLSPKSNNKTVNADSEDDNNVAVICQNSFLFEIMGLQYFKIYNLNRDNYQSGPTKLGTIRMIIVLSVLMSLVLSYVIFFVPKINTFSADDGKQREHISLKNIVKVMINYIMSSVFVAVVFVGIVQSFYTTKMHKKFIMNLKDIIEVIPKYFDLTMNLKRFNKMVKRRRIIYCLIFASMYAVAGYVYVLESYQEFFTRSVVRFIPTLFLVVVTLKIIFAIHLTTHFMELLKKILQGMRDEQKKYPPVEDKKIIEQIITVNKTLVCRQIYNKLFENSEYINHKMGLTILCAILAFVICITVTGYEFFLIMTSEFSYRGLIAVLHPNIQSTLLLSGIVLQCQRSSNLVIFFIDNINRLT